jgi:hypothetical protein
MCVRVGWGGVEWGGRVGAGAGAGVGVGVCVRGWKGRGLRVARSPTCTTDHCMGVGTCRLVISVIRVALRVSSSIPDAVCTSSSVARRPAAFNENIGFTKPEWCQGWAGWG